MLSVRQESAHPCKTFIMTGPCKRRKVKNPSAKCSRRANSRSVVKNTVAYDQTVSKVWDSSRTISQNFGAVGLVNKVNADLGGSQVRQKLEAWQAGRFDKMLEKAAEQAEVDPFLKPMHDETEIFEELEALFQESTAAGGSVVAELEARSRKVVPKAAPRLSEFERQYMEKLTQKHGCNYSKMAMDHRTNDRQLTVKEIERLAKLL